MMTSSPNPPAKLKVPGVFAGKAWQQVLARDAAADGQFFYAVKTTKIFCKPSCPSRRPERKNVTFYPTAEQALAAGFRACLRCEPESVAPRADPQVEVIDRVTTYLSEHAAERTKLKDVARATGVAPLTILRGFKRVLGVSPREFAKAERVKKLKDKLREPKMTITDAIYEAGYGSSSRAYEGAPLGMTPSAMKAGGKGESIRYALAESPLSRMLVAATARGICAVAFADSDQELLADLQTRFPQAVISRMDGELSEYVRAVVAAIKEPARAHNLPLDVRMTAFQQRVWNALQQIPCGATKTYGELAAEIGSPGAAIAVGGALGKNPVAILIPCHRVVGSGGSMTGWRWGIDRKRHLLALESKAKSTKEAEG